jgi:proteasome lid subunit RPN8/RPN11
MLVAIEIEEKHVRLIKKDAEHHRDTEACGILIGFFDKNTAVVKEAVSAENVLNSPIKFEIAPEVLYEIWHIADKKNMDIVGIYHSHVGAPAAPSARDEKFMKGSVFVWLILSKSDMNAYAWEGGVRKVRIKIV